MTEQKARIKVRRQREVVCMCFAKQLSDAQSSAA